MRLIADGVVDREGVSGLARRLSYSERHLNRQLREEVGAGPIALARAQRAHAARVLIETSDLSLTDVAFAAGFASVRQFNDTVRAVFAATPTELRSKRGSVVGAVGPGALHLRLAYRSPFAGSEAIEFLGRRAVPGIEEVDGTTYRRSLSLPRSPATVELTVANDPSSATWLACTLRLGDIRDLGAAVQRCRRLLDLDADPEAVGEALGSDPTIGALVRKTPGRRIPSTVDGSELALRAVLGQQVSLAGAKALAARLVAELGQPLASPTAGLTHLWPEPEAIRDCPDRLLPMPASRRQALKTLAGALASGEVSVDPGADRADLIARLTALPGIGPWTAQYVALRGLGDPDAFLAGDLGVRRGLERLGVAGDPRSATALAERWRPWRGYALQYLWGEAG